MTIAAFRHGVLAASLLASGVAAQPIVTSPGPSAVSVTIYRAPGRSASEPFRLEWLNGYALVTETRRIAIPAGEATIRFEGVAGGIVPESAIVSGLPDGVSERNQDAYLLSPSSLLDRSLGRRVTLRRTSIATGAVWVEEAVVRTGASGGVVIQTAAGFEALRCSGLPETIAYDELPRGLSAKPTLSVTTVGRRAATTSATVTLSYLANGFDWQANYIGKLRPDGRMDLFAWVTLANGDETSFARAGTQVVAGRPNRERAERDRPYQPPLRITCWPGGTTTSDLGTLGLESGREEIVVTGTRVRRADDFAPPPPPAPEPIMVKAMQAVQEELGDLKLYRIPEPVTFAAMSQKQVVLLDKPRVAVAAVYRRRVYAGGEDRESVPTPRVFVSRNRAADGLGLPLPAGPVALFAGGGARPLLLGEGAIDDRAVDEDVEITLSPAPGVRSQLVRTVMADDSVEYLLTVTNDQAAPVRFEAEFEGEVLGVDADTRLERRLGRPLWRVTVPANGRMSLRYR